MAPFLYVRCKFCSIYRGWRWYKFQPFAQNVFFMFSQNTVWQINYRLLISCSRLVLLCLPLCAHLCRFGVAVCGALLGCTHVIVLGSALVSSVPEIGGLLRCVRVAVLLYIYIHIYKVEMWWSRGQLQYSSVGLLTRRFNRLGLHQEHTDYMSNIQILKYALTVDISWRNKIV